MHELWTELYRPNKIEDYVFRDAAQRRQIEGWVKEGALPHLLFSGAPGTGKCLGGSEEIEVEINNSSLTPKQIMALSIYKTSS